MYKCGLIELRFHGSPTRILIGRVIALGMLFAYNYSVRLQSALTIVVLAAIAFVMPWLLRNSFRFRPSAGHVSARRASADRLRVAAGI